MANFTELKRRYNLLHRFMCGITITSLILTIIGGFVSGISLFRVVFNAAGITFALLLAEYLTIRLWSSWEEVQYGTGRK